MKHKIEGSQVRMLAVLFAAALMVVLPACVAIKQPTATKITGGTVTVGATTETKYITTVSVPAGTITVNNGSTSTVTVTAPGGGTTVITTVSAPPVTVATTIPTTISVPTTVTLPPTTVTSTVTVAPPTTALLPLILKITPNLPYLFGTNSGASSVIALFTLVLQNPNNAAVNSGIVSAYFQTGLQHITSATLSTFSGGSYSWQQQGNSSVLDFMNYPNISVAANGTLSLVLELSITYTDTITPVITPGVQNY